ncbi:site-specific integrase [Nocardiopsis trehalosi]|jgi:integrase/recombinase XerC/integrase/recombinase XerD|uniref:site-specific integrase n=1 Tax=Nocardiopsis trehalosi TaxID=109329 RepID=UPI00082AC275|nr:site-specific integrase [Nocardiopsis trehalosi]
MTVVPLHQHGEDVTLGEAVGRFLARYRHSPATRREYARTLLVLEAAAGSGMLSLSDLTPDVFASAMRRWEHESATVWNGHLACLRSFAAFALRQRWVDSDPSRHLRRRAQGPAGGAALPA